MDGQTYDSYSLSETRDLIVALRDSVFDGQVGELAIALGRPVDEVEGWADGTFPIDDEGLIKARGIADRAASRMVKGTSGG
ncbi:MAG: hypothetical protein ABIP75_16515 [Pyrinomonadaceae bacterium]